MEIFVYFGSLGQALLKLGREADAYQHLERAEYLRRYPPRAPNRPVLAIFSSDWRAFRH